jgi:hypothetical protein
MELGENMGMIPVARSAGELGFLKKELLEEHE